MTVNKNPHINTITFLKNKPNSKYAFEILKDINNSIALLMNENGLKVSILSEFYPKQNNLLGLNINHGYKIMLRLRQPFDDSRFLSRDEIMNTMIHELTHNKIGPHNNKFKKLMNEWCGRQYVIETLGLTYNFLGQGQRLGGKKVDGKYNIRQQRISCLQNESINKDKDNIHPQKLGVSNKIGKQRLSPREMAAKAAIERLQKKSTRQFLPIAKNNADENVNVEEILSQHHLMESQVEDIIIIDSDSCEEDEKAEDTKNNSSIYSADRTQLKPTLTTDFIDLT